MPVMKTKPTIFICAILICTLLTACQQSSKSSQTRSPAKRYEVKGTAVMVEKAEQLVRLDHEDIKDPAGKVFMDARQMSNKDRDDQALATLATGDQVQAKLV